MAYSIHGRISYILEAIGNKLSYVKKLNGLRWADFFSFLTKIFHNI